MLKLLLGRAGTGKSAAIFRQIAAHGKVRRQLLIVPEQASHEVERRLCRELGNQASLYAEVLSFTRLSSRVLAKTGGLAAPTLDAGGRMLLMYAALKSVSNALTVYARPSKKPAFLSGLLATLDECKQYCVTPEALSRAGEGTEGQEGEKLKDLGMIFGAYDALTARVAADPRDRITRLAKELANSDYARGISVYLDGFTDFTPQQLQVIRQLLIQAEDVTIALTCGRLDREEDAGEIFRPAQRTVARLLRLAQEVGSRFETFYHSGQRGEKRAALAHLERNLFADAPETYPVPVQEVTLFAAMTPRSELEWTASEILKIVREKGYRFREVAVVARGFERYHTLIQEVFRRYGIPIFLDSMTDILQKPVFAVVTGALDVVAGQYRYEDVFRYLKTGLAGLSLDECDKLENYVLKWDLKGSRWTSQRDWNMHPRGYGFPMTEGDQELLIELNRLRRKVCGPLERLRKNPDKTGNGQAISLYNYLEEIELPQKLLERAQRLQDRGELKEAEEYGQLWEILCQGLEQCAQILGEIPMELEEFAQLLKLVLSQYEVGAIPVSLDQVTAGEAVRLGSRPIRALFFLGADDGAIPQTAPAPGLLTDDDRSLLASFGLELSPQLSDKLDREMTILYEACSKPSERLTVSWAAQTTQGEEQRPSLLVTRLRLLFPQNQTVWEQSLRGDFRFDAPDPALEQAGRFPEVRAALRQIPEYVSKVDRLEKCTQWERGRLSPEGVSSLYGSRVPMSASRMDKYRACHFSYFMQFGLKAKARKPAGFQAPEYGTFVHYVLEHILRDRNWQTTDSQGEQNWKQEDVRRRIKTIMDRYIVEELGGLENKTPRFLYLFDRLLGPVTQVVENVLEELAASRFEPIAFELGFGVGKDLPPVELTVDGITVSLSGFVDRLDGWVHNGRLYLRVMDYKTGRKSFDLTEIWNGMGLQMLLYLFTLEEQGEKLYNYAVTPAGVLYLPARTAVIQGSRRMEEQERKKRMDMELRRHGLVLDDPEVLEAMEQPTEEGLRFLPVRVSAKTGAITGEALVSAERLGKLKRHTQHILNEIGQELAAGVIDADPFWRGPEKNACLYCDYAAACHFEEGRGSDRRRYLPSLSGEAFWSSVEKEDVERMEGDVLRTGSLPPKF